MAQHTTRSRYKQLLERKRQSRRKLALRRLAALMLLVVVVAVVLGLVFGIRGCSQRTNQSAEVPKQRVSKPDSEISKVQLTFAHDFRPGPRFVALDDKHLYVGALTPGKGDAPPTTLLAGFDYLRKANQQDPVWQSPVEATFSQMLVSGGTIIAVPDSGDSMQRFHGETGKPMTVIDADPANAQIAMNSRLVVAGYVDDSSGRPTVRLAAYNTQSGKFAWSRRSKLTGLSSGLDACCGSQHHVELSCWESVCAYRLHNVVGLVTTTGKGKLVRPEYAASGHIAAVQLDVPGGMA
ncbi:MAG: PQQ-like beta-propeller repeat protein, partial [bacterium]|nr:PQQ-like beta-propeller repeat protein [bacterium]